MFLSTACQCQYRKKKNWNLWVEYKAKEISKCMEDECCTSDRDGDVTRMPRSGAAGSVVCLYLDQCLEKFMEAFWVHIMSLRRHQRVLTPSHPHAWAHTLQNQSRVQGVGEGATGQPLGL